jgi:MoaA/NifB/PqqE/SkfB family radical SAM enzyme
MNYLKIHQDQKNRLQAYAPKRIDLEITRKCPIDCPMCPRTTGKNKKDKWMLDHISLDAIRNITKIKSLDFVSICGIYGDGIYHPKFHEILQIIKDSPVRVNIETNGAHRTQAWWEKCENLFKENDSVTFSIDGLEKNNHIYRINTNWDSIMIGVKTLRRVCPNIKLIWKWIYFKYNQYDTLEGYKLSKELGFDSFEIVESARTNDPNLFPSELRDIYLTSRPIQEAVEEINFYKAQQK